MATSQAAGKAAPPAGWRPRVLVSDVDGTLTQTNRRLDAEAVEALRASEAAGVPVVLATGNVLPIVYALAYFIGTTGPIVAENGGLVYFKGNVERLSDASSVEGAAREVERRLGLRRLFTDQWRLTEVGYPEGPTTFDDVRAAVERAGLSDAVAVERTGFAVHLMARGVTKFTGVVRALAAMGLGPQDALAVGDSDNDRSILVGCRAGVALANASPALKAAADHVAVGPMGAGIFEALRRYRVIDGPISARGGGRPGAPKRARRAPPRAARQRRRASPARRPTRTARAGRRARRQ